ncbi:MULTISPECIES: hypothetical protein [Acinetobacter calcoaceticus/baumannii complex]|uniref:hypothetical protein n=1 Tax=Acinetobacter calcoaceticus/baumannii complex TaxID=909768 RepID=UPI00070D9BC8|nr:MULTISPECIES: hypothetical protein [Acinetobacter calcoaceticus/baumannii complex]KRJ70799.1 hypothetical protein APC93_11725 [Acinetobacter pittii]TPT55504.1 hypothetical protein FJU64_08220 [Acinetobacter baumannii]
MTAKKTSFCQTLGNLQHGDTLHQLDDLLSEALQASNDTGKVSKVSVTLTIKPNGRGTYKIMDDVKSTLPKFDKEPTVLFTDGDQQLVREDPRQQKLKLEQVSESGPVELKSIPTETKQTFKTLN